ncbi:ras and EF-hand domain-containing protein-like isoform X2 [Brienomyrus brachyistius]|uniref:ras and EF-hand domain-containing protein-like isoform X2 n=1 Tax=Brienomyrus brachyistius TaxID=42636 RepID=UPI0020B208D9|nr:ras and EF-hand domain-containing protein-like isoform X2 [Brienomyrus brachyistius]
MLTALFFTQFVFRKIAGLCHTGLYENRTTLVWFPVGVPCGCADGVAGGCGGCGDARRTLCTSSPWAGLVLCTGEQDCVLFEDVSGTPGAKLAGRKTPRDPGNGGVTSPASEEEETSDHHIDVKNSPQKGLGRIEETVCEMERRRPDSDSATQREYKFEMAELQAALKRLNKEKEQLNNALTRAQVNISNMQVELDVLKMENIDQRLRHEREKNELQKMLIEYQSYCSHTKLVQQIKRNLHDSNDLFQSILARTAESRSSKVPSKDEHILGKLKPSVQTTSSWADQYLDSGLSLWRDEEDSSSTEFDCEDHQENLDSPCSDASIPYSNPNGMDSVAPSRRQSVSSTRRRLSAFPNQDTADVRGTPPVYRLVLAGDAGTGKSSFLLRLSTNEFRGDIRTTLGVDMHNKKMLVDGEETTLQIWDTAGQERFRSITRSYFRKAHGVFLLYDVTSESSFLSIREWIDQIQESIDKPVSMCVVGNKVDLRSEHPEGGCVSTGDGEKLATEYSALFCETSAKDGTNIVEAVLHLAREVKKRVVSKEPSEPQVTLSLEDEDETDGAKTATRRCCRM